MKTNARRTILVAAAAMLLAACSAGSALTEPPRPSQPPVAIPGDPGAVPGDPGEPPRPSQPPVAIPGDPGVVPGDPGEPIGTQPAPGYPGIGGPPDGQPAIVIPKPGRLGVHPVGPTKLEAQVDGRRVRVTVTWWSGVEPCSVLDSVALIRDGTNIAIELREGADQLGVACIEIAMLKATVVDLGELLPGAYVVSAGGDASPIRVTVR